MSRESDLGWAAGIIDGEGCIEVARQHGRRYPESYHLRLSIFNTSIRMLHKFREVVGSGRICPVKRRRAHHKQGWTWQARDRSAEIVLRQLAPYCVAKAEEVELGLLSRQYIGRAGAKNYQKEQWAWLKARLSELHHEEAQPGGADVALRGPRAPLPLFEEE